MRNTITLNGVESSTIPGLLIQELPAISKPLMRTEVETIDGRDGDITTDLGFSAYDKQISIGLFADYDIDQIIAYFNSKGTVIFSNEPDKFYNYEIVDQIDFERLVRYRTATVTMHCQPFKYSTTEGADILSTNSNFATLNQSLNTDTGFYTYSSNVQDDVTATRSSGTGGKFFAVFSVPVVQGVTYYFSGNVSKNVSMYGYTNQLRGTSAGISGKGFNGYFTYTATFTGTMVLGFYSNATTEIFIRNFKVSNQSTSTVSGEGTNIVLENSAEAPFSRFDLKGNTEQDAYSGKNFFNINGTRKQNARCSVTISGETLTITSTQNSTGYAAIVIPNSDNLLGKTCTISCNATNSSGGVRLVVFQGNSTNATSVSDDVVTLSNSGANVATFTFPNSFASGKDCFVVCPYVSNAGTNTQVGDYSTFSNIQIEVGSSATIFEPYVGGMASPNPDYPQDVRVVTGENTVRICGKNLFDYTNYVSSGGGLTTTLNSDGSLTTTGIPTYSYVDIVPRKNIIDLLEDGATYRLSQSYSDNPKAIFIEVTASKVGGGIDYYSGSFVVNKTTHTNYIIHVCTNTQAVWGNQTRTITSNFQLEKGSVATEFEPYHGKEFELNLGKNLFDKDNANTFNGYNNNGVLSAVSGTYIVYIPCLPNTTYTVQKIVSTIDPRFNVFTTAEIPANGVAVIDSVGTPSGSNTSPSLTITTSNNAKYLGVFYAKSTTVPGENDTLASIQIEKGSTATSYAPYFTPIELCKIGTYQDYFYKSGDKWYLHKETGKKKLNETSGAWAVQSNGNIYALAQNLYTPIGMTGRVVACNCLTYWDSSSATWNVNYRIGVNTGHVIWITTGDTSVNTNETIMNWFTAHDAVIYYPLANPTDTEITNENLKAQLEAISEANAYRGRTHIISIAATGNVPHIIAAEVATDPSGTITNSGNIYSKPKLTIFGSGNVGVYLNGVQMFQIALGTNDYITIDTAIMEAYQDNLQTLKNRSVTGDYNNFKLPVGESEISFSGNVTMCVVENYSRWL